jgi:hypothetical protein
VDTILSTKDGGVNRMDLSSDALDIIIPAILLAVIALIVLVYAWWDMKHVVKNFV